MGKKAKDKKNVILYMPEPATWTFMSFVTDMERDVAEDWDVEKTFGANLAYQSMVKNCQKISNHAEWTALRHPMDRQAGKAGVIELGFKEDDKQYRFLCMFNGKKCIVLLCVAYHKDSVWTPRKAVEIATKRAKTVAEGKAKLNVIEIKDDI